MKNILVIGSGGREHALAWKLIQSEHTQKVFVAPGNAGTECEENIINVDISSDDIDALLEFSQAESIDLVVVGPEAPLVAGIVDIFTTAGINIFGPKQYNAQLEGSKTFAKQFMHKYNIPTAEYATFTEPKSALDYLSKKSLPIVIKADGLAAGKGVVIAHSADEAQHAVMTILSGDAHGDAGKKIVIEEFIQGEEVSFICVVDHDTIIPLASSQDHKARDAGDLGPNTGGMGAYSPSPLVDEAMHKKIMQQVIIPTVNGFMDAGHPYQGFLYAGIMITPDGEPKVLEFNCRLGDPETQPIMLRLEDDLSEICYQVANHQLLARPLKWSPQSALGVVLASEGYPYEYSKGDKISGLDHVHAPYAKIFHAGTVRMGNDIKTLGGRVLCVTALGADVEQAQKNAYTEVKRIHWDNMFYRQDIGYRAIKN